MLAKEEKKAKKEKNARKKERKRERKTDKFPLNSPLSKFTPKSIVATFLPLNLTIEFTKVHFENKKPLFCPPGLV